MCQAASLNWNAHSPLCVGSTVALVAYGLLSPSSNCASLGLPTLIPAPLFWDETLSVHGKGLLAEHKKDNEPL